MAYQIPKIQYSGNIRQVTLGQGPKAIRIGGQEAYNFHAFEGKLPNLPRIAMEVWDMVPEEWPEAAKAPFQGVLADPGAWAKKCVEEYGADIIAVELRSIDPNGLNKSAQEASAQVKKVVDAVDVPVIVWGCANPEKDAEVLKKIAEDFEGKHLAIGPVEEKNHKVIGAAALAFKHTVISSSPIDVNLAKQVNILLENLGVKGDVVIDPTTGGLGYGLEYGYSVMERIRMAALAQEDDKLQFPLVNNLGFEIWKCKEAKMTHEEAPNLGDPARRGILMEAVAGVVYALAGSDVLIMRHPESVKLARKFFDYVVTGDLSISPAELAEKLSRMKQKPEGEYPPIVKEVVAEPVKEAAAPKEAAPKPKPEAAPAKTEPVAAPKPEPVKEVKPVVEVAPAVDEAKVKAEAEAKKKAEEEARQKAEAEAKVRAEAEAKQKAENEARKKAEEEALKKKAEEEAQAKAQAEKAAVEEARRSKRAEERAERLKEHAHEDMEVSMTPAAVQMSFVEKLLAGVDRVHRRSMQ